MTICPAVFDMDEQGHGFVVMEDIPLNLKAEVDEAVFGCPDSAISATD